MKETLITILAVILIVSMAACSIDEDTVNVQETEKIPEAEVTEPTVKPQESQTSKESVEVTESEDKQEEEDIQKLLEYLKILGLDENTQYTILDKFPIEGSEDISILTDIIGIDEEAFEAIINTMEANGSHLVSDIMRDEERQTTSMQFRNADDTLYIELVYSTDAEYINIIFSPIN